MTNILWYGDIDGQIIPYEIGKYFAIFVFKRVVLINKLISLLKEKVFIILCNLVRNINDFTISKKISYQYYISCIEIECEPHKYGPDCTLDCGHCERGKSCLMDTGACPDGCEEGWAGERCDIRKYLMSINYYVYWYICMHFIHLKVEYIRKQIETY